LKIKVPKESFQSDAIEELFGSPKEPFSEQFLNEPCFPHYNLLWNRPFPWILKVLHRTINANKEYLF